MNCAYERDPVVFIVDDDHSVRLGLVDLFASIGLKALCFASVNFSNMHVKKSRPALSSMCVCRVRAERNFMPE